MLSNHHLALSHNMASRLQMLPVMSALPSILQPKVLLIASFSQWLQLMEGIQHLPQQVALVLLLQLHPRLLQCKFVFHCEFCLLLILKDRVMTPFPSLELRSFLFVYPSEMVLAYLI